jgi:hypothetical protein
MPKTIILTFVIVISVTGCNGISAIFGSDKVSPMVSYTSELFPPDKAGLIANDITERLVSGYPPGQTSVFLFISGEGPVAQAIENNLRSKGFHISPEEDPSSLTLSWRLDQLDQTSWYLTVNLSSGYRFSRIYNLNGSSLTPVGSLSQGIF